MIKSSLPESSPFTTTDLPMVATSWLRRLSLRVASGGRVGALRGGLKVGTGGPCSGPGVVCSSSLRFHILELHAVAATGQEASDLGRVGALRGGLKVGTGGPCSGPGVVCSSSLRFHILELHAVAATGQEAS